MISKITEMKQLSLRTIYELFELTIKNLMQHYNLEEGTNFSGLKQFLMKQQMQDPQKDAWTIMYQEFLRNVKSNLIHVFVQENKELKLVMISFLGYPNSTRDYRQIRGIMYNNPHQNQTILFDIWQGKAVTSFHKKPLPFSNFEFNSFYNKFRSIYQDNSTIQTTRLPVGIQIQLAFHQDWNICTRNVLRINESKLIGKNTIMEKLEQLLNKYQTSITQLDKKTHYTFHLCSQEYQVIPCKDELFFINAFNPFKSKTDISAVRNLPRLPQFRQKGLPQKNQIKYWLNSFNDKTPTYSINFSFNSEWTDTMGNKQIYNNSIDLLTPLGDLIDEIRKQNGNAEQQLNSLHDFCYDYPYNKYVIWYNKYMNKSEEEETKQVENEDYEDLFLDDSTQSKEQLNPQIQQQDQSQDNSSERKTEEDYTEQV